MKRRLVIAGIAVVVAAGLGVGAVFAYFEATGHGTGSADQRHGAHHHHSGSGQWVAEFDSPSRVDR